MYRHDSTCYLRTTFVLLYMDQSTIDIHHPVLQRILSIINNTNSESSDLVEIVQNLLDHKTILFLPPSQSEEEEVQQQQQQLEQQLEQRNPLQQKVKDESFYPYIQRKLSATTLTMSRELIRVSSQHSLKASAHEIYGLQFFQRHVFQLLSEDRYVTLEGVFGILSINSL